MYFAITCTNVDYFKICESRALEMNMIVVIVVSIAADDNDTAIVIWILRIRRLRSIRDAGK